MSRFLFFFWIRWVVQNFVRCIIVAGFSYFGFPMMYLPLLAEPSATPQTRQA